MTVVLRVGGGVEGLDELTPELREWATVSQALGSRTAEARTIVRLRGEQLAARYAAALRTEVVVVDGAQVRVFGAAEPTPWATGLVVAGFSAPVVLVALVVLGENLARVHPLLAVVANLVVVGGLAPSVWLCRALPVWRWVALGVVVGVVLAWTWLLFA